MMVSTGVWLDTANSKLIIEVAERCVVTMPDPMPMDHEDVCDMPHVYNDPKRVEVWLPEYVVQRLVLDGVEVLGTAEQAGPASGGATSPDELREAKRLAWEEGYTEGFDAADNIRPFRPNPYDAPESGIVNEVAPLSETKEETK